MKIAVMDLLQKAHDEYFSLLIKNYPTQRDDDISGSFGPPELCALAIEVHSCAIALGASALNRLNYIGLSDLYPFDNPVDLYGWREHVRKNEISHTIYASIAIRIDSELKRMRKVIEVGGSVSYEALPPDIFLVSKERYTALNPGADVKRVDTPPPQGQTHIGSINITTALDSAAVSKLEALEQKTTVWSNYSNIISTLRTLLGE